MSTQKRNPLRTYKQTVETASGAQQTLFDGAADPAESRIDAQVTSGLYRGWMDFWTGGVRKAAEMQRRLYACRSVSDVIDLQGKIVRETAEQNTKQSDELADLGEGHDPEMHPFFPFTSGRAQERRYDEAA